jgi:hypothetical protein
MKEEIYTIPVMDAFSANGCPFCAMKLKLERESIGFMLGPSYMEDGIRMETDRKGFCHRHFTMMHEEQNRLGLALLASTRLKKVISALEGLPAGAPAKKGFLQKAADPMADMRKSLSEMLGGSPDASHSAQGCYICDRMEGTFSRYVSTFFYMWPKEAELRSKFESASLCVPHFAMLLESGQKELKGSAFPEFSKTLADVAGKWLKKLDADLDLFIKKFDYRYRDEPAGESAEALPRVIKALSGDCGLK